ncbi:MAG: penicillin-binding protein activator [Polyangia bacterium]
MHPDPPQRKWMLLGLGLSMLLTGCPHRFDSRADPIPASTDPVTEREYRQARARLEAGDAASAATLYAEFVAKHPDDPLTRSAKIGEARARLSLGQNEEAKTLLVPIARPEEPADPKADPVRGRARFLLGEALVRSGEYARGRALLTEFSDVAATSEDEIELHALFASASLGLADWSSALVELGRFWEAARPAERRYILGRAREAADKLAPEELERLWRGDHNALLTAFVGPRIAEQRRQLGDIAAEARIEADVATAQSKLGIGVAHAAEGGAIKSVVGCVLPLSGKAHALGDRALRGALLGAELLGGGGQGSLALEIRDSGSDPQRAKEAVEELARLGVMAIVGPPDRAEAPEVVAAAAPFGVPLFALGPDEGRTSGALFHVARPRSDSARAAARLIAEDGLRRVAVLAPDGASGRDLARVFVEAARARGLEIVADVRFGENATTFVKEVRQVEATRPQAIFLPATATQLDLVVPQLASSGMVAMTNLKPSGHEARLYATADGLSGKSLVRSGKYLQGATLLPPFWIDPADPRGQAFLERYHDAYGDEPSVLDALAYDAVRSLRLVVSQRGEPHAWADVNAGLRELDAGGLTGPIGYTATGDRSGEAGAWIVEGATLRPRTLRRAAP